MNPAAGVVAVVGAGVANAERREKINRIEAEIVKLPKAAISIVHHFAPGIYAREMRVPAGSAITGKIHKTRHLNIVSHGRLQVFNEIGGLDEITAPFAFVSEAGTRRAAVIHEDVVWTTVHPNPENETDPDKLEAMLVEDAQNPLIVGAQQPEALT